MTVGDGGREGGASVSNFVFHISARLRLKEKQFGHRNEENNLLGGAPDPV